jgi:hypothetical protein
MGVVADHRAETLVECGVSRVSWQIAVRLIGALLLTGCASSVALRVPPSTPGAPSCVTSVPDRDLLVGVALSGGGSRAALFGAAGLRALGSLRTADGASVLEQVSLISSVSGGSLAASYYAVNKPDRGVPVLGPDGELSAAYRAFFERYTGVLTQDFERKLIRQQLRSLRWLNSSLAARSLFEVLQKDLLGTVTIGELSRRQRRGDSPGLVINTTLYNNGRRLAGTSLPTEAFKYNLAEDLEAFLRREGRSGEVPAVLSRRASLLLPMTPPDLDMDVCHTAVAGWVTASASFPPLVGPITFRGEGQKTYWHAGDGGLYENQGIESLLFLFLNRLQDRQTRRALIIAFDSSFPFSVGDRRLSERARPFSLWTFDFSRVPGIMEERASTYQALLFRTLQLEGVLPDERTLWVVLLHHTEAQWRADLADLPSSCRAERHPFRSPADVTRRIAEIPTRLRVPSQCDRDLLSTAAAKVVAQRRDEILGFLDRDRVRARP